MTKKEIERIKDERKIASNRISEQRRILNAIANELHMPSDSSMTEILINAIKSDNRVLRDKAIETFETMTFEHGIRSICSIILVDVAHTF